MALIKIPFGKFLEGAAAPIVKKVMTSLGLGVVSFAAISTALTAGLDMAQNAYSGLPQNILALCNLGGVGEALGILAGAMVFRVAFTSMDKIGVIPK